jgi:hypothetical protein
MNAADRLFEQNLALVKADEDWHDSYKDDERSFTQLLKSESKMQRAMLQYFASLAVRVPNYVNWFLYNSELHKVKADAGDEFNVDVIVTQLPDTEDHMVINIVYEPVAIAVAAGLSAAEQAYVPLPEVTHTDVLEKVARNSIARLVGRGADPEYSITEGTRTKIRQSIKTSLTLGETQAQATKRLMSKTGIKDPKRAARIAATESVNAYQSSKLEYAIRTGAVTKRWRAIPGACRICMGNMAAGDIDIKDKFPSGHLKPSGHPWCRCGIVYGYPK